LKSDDQGRSILAKFQEGETVRAWVADPQDGLVPFRPVQIELPFEERP
jgi:hypothetical protein